MSKYSAAFDADPMQTPLLATLRRACVLVTLLCCAAAHAGVDVNTATEAELDGVKGIGPRTTAIILAERAHGPFKNWQDLIARVKGIKPASASRLSANGLTVDETPFVPPPGKSP
jgi:competence protein ComEA